MHGYCICFSLRLATAGDSLCGWRNILAEYGWLRYPFLPCPFMSIETEWQIGNPRLQQDSDPDIIHEPKLRTPGNFAIGRTTAAADQIMYAASSKPPWIITPPWCTYKNASLPANRVMQVRCITSWGLLHSPSLSPSPPPLPPPSFCLSTLISMCTHQRPSRRGGLCPSNKTPRLFAGERATLVYWTFWNSRGHLSGWFVKSILCHDKQHTYCVCRAPWSDLITSSHKARIGGMVYCT